MPTLRKTVASVAAALLVAGGVGLSTNAPAQAGGAAAHSAVLPYPGSYMGSDAGRRTIKFTFDGHRINHFSINHHVYLSGAGVQGHQVHHYCNSANTMCIRGTWVSDVEFVGHWNDPRQGHSVTFTANLYSH